MRLCVHQVTDWDDMETIWKYVYHAELGTLPEEVSQ